ncbi:hypothetical protein MJ561_00450 [Klebsiella pneumoniae]|nr:hypothetical protein MJ561_00450 [Klebsiella pneumoniae]
MVVLAEVVAGGIMYMMTKREVLFGFKGLFPPLSLSVCRSPVTDRARDDGRRISDTVS